MNTENTEEEFVNGATDGDIEQPLGEGEIPKGIWKQFVNIEYNQLEVDPYSCTVVSTYTALSNLTGKRVVYGMMKDTLDRMRKDGKFTPGFGASLSDGVRYSLEDWNRTFKTNYKSNLIFLSPTSISNGLKVSPIVTGIKYGKGFVADTQEADAWVNGATSVVIGTQGHATTIVKINTMEDILIKICNSYFQRLTNNVFGIDFNKYRALFFNTGYYFTKN